MTFLKLGMLSFKNEKEKKKKHFSELNPSGIEFNVLSIALPLHLVIFYSQKELYFQEA